MTSNTQLQDVNDVLNRNAVQFEPDRRYNNQSAWPFWYPLIPRPYLNTDILNNGQGLLGFNVPAGKTRSITVRLDRDAVYRQLNVKYTAFRCILGSALSGTVSLNGGSQAVVGVLTAFLTEAVKGTLIAFTDDSGVVRCGRVLNVVDNLNLTLEQAVPLPVTAKNLFLGAYSWFDDVRGNIFPKETFHMQYLTQFLRVTYVMDSLRGRYLYGGTQEFIAPDSEKNGMQERPLLISALQGKDDGLGQVRTAMVYPYEASVTIKVENIFTEDILVNGTLFGYKISGDKR